MPEPPVAAPFLLYLHCRRAMSSQNGQLEDQPVQTFLCSMRNQGDHVWGHIGYPQWASYLRTHRTTAKSCCDTGQVVRGHDGGGNGVKADPTVLTKSL